MSTHPRDPIRTLFVLSADFGELVLALNFLDGQAFAPASMLLLPDGLFRHNGSRLPVPTRRYQSLNDILRAAEAHDPEIVFLFSGYLFPTNRLLSPRAVTQLVQHLGRRGCRLVTSDPLLGLSSQLTLRDIDFQMALAGKPALLRWFFRWLLSRRDPNSKTAEIPILSDLVHLYPAPTGPLDGGEKVARASFFNPAAVAHGRAVAAAPGDCNGRPRWLFVLASTDSAIQHTLHGKMGFTEILLQKLHQTVLAGRQPTLVGPLPVIERLRRFARQLPSLAGAELLPFCPHDQFYSLLMSSEYVFYWNVFTCSLLPRMASGLPAFFFDRGHVSRCLPRFYEIGIRCYFTGWEPTFLDQRSSLDPGLLGALAEKQRPMIQAIGDYWRQSPAPEQVLVHLMSRSHAPAKH